MSATQPAPPALGVGAILADSFAIYFRRIGAFAMLPFLPILVTQLVSLAAVGGALVDPSLGGAAEPSGGAMFVAWLLQTVGYSIAAAFLVQAAYDAKLGRPVRVRDCILGTLGRIVPLVIATVIMTVCVGLASMALVVPGLWLYAVWSVAAPAIVVEKRGLDALARSSELTKGYRWPILGALAVLLTCVVLLSMALVAVSGLALASAAGGHAVYAGAVLQALASALSAGILYVGIALIYARLREIKEGTGVEALAEVFA